MLRLNLTHILYQVMFSISFFSADSSPSTWAGFLVVLRDGVLDCWYMAVCPSKETRLCFRKGSWCQDQDWWKCGIFYIRGQTRWLWLASVAKLMILSDQFVVFSVFTPACLGPWPRCKKIPGAIHIIWKKWKTKKRIHHSKLSQDVWWKGKEE